MRRTDGRFIQQSLENNQAESIALQERFPRKHTSRSVIANALFHTCCHIASNLLLMIVLATRGVLWIEQKEAYGEISLRVAI